MEENQPKHEELSEIKVMRSAAGYYIGREQYQQGLAAWQPYNRLSGYMNDQQQAEKLLQKSLEFKKTINEIGTGNLRIVYNSLNEKINDDPHNGLKRNLIKDTMQHDRGYNIEISQMPAHEITR